ncbi:MAG: four helix bundle protein, partial [Saprospiraceae bacterium]|nr:four helix bundle protein [Saprospiraceae bacterium]
MSGWTRIEEIQIWQLSREICQEVWTITRRPVYRQDLGLRGQMLDSSGSMMDNVAEGFERGSNGEFRSFLGYAKGSSGELRSQLMRSADRQFITPEEL